MGTKSAPRLPFAGAVIRYGYLWGNEVDRARAVAAKDRPCVIAFVFSAPEPSNRSRVALSPISHTVPEREVEGIELSGRTRSKLGLDARRQWIVLPEVNALLWPGEEQRPTPLGADLYGVMPDPIMQELRNRLARLHRAGRLRTVPR